MINFLDHLDHIWALLNAGVWCDFDFFDRFRYPESMWKSETTNKSNTKWCSHCCCPSIEINLWGTMLRISQRRYWINILRYSIYSELALIIFHSVCLYAEWFCHELLQNVCHDWCFQLLCMRRVVEYSNRDWIVQYVLSILSKTTTTTTESDTDKIIVLCAFNGTYLSIEASCHITSVTRAKKHTTKEIANHTHFGLIMYTFRTIYNKSQTKTKKKKSFKSS